MPYGKNNRGRWVHINAAVIVPGKLMHNLAARVRMKQSVLLSVT